MPFRKVLRGQRPDSNTQKPPRKVPPRWLIRKKGRERAQEPQLSSLTAENLNGDLQETTLPVQSPQLRGHTSYATRYKHGSPAKTSTNATQNRHNTRYTHTTNTKTTLPVQSPPLQITAHDRLTTNATTATNTATTASTPRTLPVQSLREATQNHNGDLPDKAHHYKATIDATTTYERPHELRPPYNGYKHGSPTATYSYKANEMP